MHISQHTQKHHYYPEGPSETLFDWLVRSTWPVIRKEGKAPQVHESFSIIANELKSVVPSYSDDITRMVLEAKSRSASGIEVGESADIIPLLSCNGEMLELVRKNGEVVKVEEKTFEGKYVMVCCFHVPFFRDEATDLQNFISTCSDLYAKRDDFEMVMVAKMNYLANYNVIFDHFFSGFPSSCLAVPFSDSKRRDYICKYLDFDRSGFDGIECFLLDVSRTVLNHGYPEFVSIYGADLFPFTDECIEAISAKEMSYWKAPRTLEDLVECNAFDLDDIGLMEKVSISDLSEKIVGLYLCYTGSLIPTLHEVYLQCRARRLEFEVVLVYMPFADCLDPVVFQSRVDTSLKKKKISWWRLPFDNSVAYKFWRFSDCNPEDKLIIVGPHGEFMDPNGGDIMSCYGIDVYPFTRKSLVEWEVNKMRALTLESLFEGSCGYVHRGKDTKPVSMAELKGRNILLYLEDLYNLGMLKYLLKWYKEIQKKDSRFEVVFVCLRDTTTEGVTIDFSEKVSAMPWFVCPYDPDHATTLSEKISTKVGPYNTLVAIGEDGKVCSFRAHDYLFKHGSDAFPFKDDLRQEVITQLGFSFEFMENMEF